MGLGAARFPAERLATFTAFAVAALIFATWLPHYLTWPLWFDTDSYLMMAHAWQDGLVPYRDVAALNFPGQVYVSAVIGRVVGWDAAPLALHVFDAATVAAFAAALVLWSRRVLGRALPGAAGAVAFLMLYFGLDFTCAMQRDWHAGGLAIASVLCGEAAKSRGGRAASGFLFAAALTFRPHVVVFLPAALSALVESRGEVTESGPPPARRVGEWCVAFVAGVVAAALPLVLAGAFGDFVRGLAEALPGGAYAERGRAMRDGFAAGVLSQAADVRRVLLPAAAWILAARLGSPLRAVARTWAVASAGALAYQPLHPFAYPNLEIPARTVTVVSAAVLAGVVMSCEAWRPAWRVAGVAIACWLATPDAPAGLPRRPAYCSVSDSLEAIDWMARGRTPATTPPGARDHFRPNPYAHYAWPDYVRTLDHLRERPAPATRVAPMFMHSCFPAVLGMTGRVSAFPSEAGVMSGWWFGEEAERRCAEALERTPDSVVVWVPGEEIARHGRSQPLLESTVRRLYVPDERFGAIEVWRRR
jgi:hypothetical protein